LPINLAFLLREIEKIVTPAGDLCVKKLFDLG
jgi:hypothetical protein